MLDDESYCFLLTDEILLYLCSYAAILLLCRKGSFLTIINYCYRSQDYIQYYLDLNQSNYDGAAHWDKEYRFTEDLNVKDLSVASMANLTLALADDPDMLRKFALYNSVSYKTDSCDDRCRLYHLCSIKYLDEEMHEACVYSVDSPVPIVIYGAASAAAGAAAATALICCANTSCTCNCCNTIDV